MAASEAFALPTPLIQISGTILTILIDGLSWEVDGRFWDPIKTPTAPGPLPPYEIKCRGDVTGTNLDLPMEARLYTKGSSWRIQLAFRGRPPQDYSFAEWASGASRYDLGPVPGSIKLGENAQANLSGVRWSIDGKFRITIESVSPVSAGVSFNCDRVRATAKTLTLERRTNLSQPAAIYAGNDPTPGALATLAGVALETLRESQVANARADQITPILPSNPPELRALRRAQAVAGPSVALGGVHDNWMVLEPVAPTVSIETFLRKNGSRGGALRLDAAKAYLLVTGTNFLREFVRIELANAQLLANLADADRKVKLDTDLSAAPQAVAANEFAVEVCSFQGARSAIDFDLNSKARRIHLKAALAAVSLPVVGVTRCDGIFDKVQTDLVFGAHDPSPGEAVPGGGLPPPCDGLLRLGERNHLHVAMENGVLRLRRSADLFDLSFGFRGYGLDVDGQVHKIVREMGRACDTVSPRPLLIVHFPPQHLQEEAFLFQDPTNGFQDPINGPVETTPLRSRLLRGTMLGRRALTAPSSPPRRINVSAPFATIDGNEETTYLARTRASGPTRLVFGFGEQTPAPTEYPIDIKALTDWRKLTLMVHRRAAQADLTLDDQIAQIAGIGPRDDRNKARQLIEESLTPPSSTETAMELVTGLVFSPDGRAKFETPLAHPDPTRPKLWGARLNPDVRTSVRAIWAPGVDLTLKGSAPGQDSIPVLPGSDNRRDLVLLSSAYGVAAMRALTGTGGDVPHSLVRRPKGDFDYLSDDALPLPESSVPSPVPPSPGKPVTVLQEGVVAPVAFRKFDAELSAIGASLDADWQGEPARPWKDVKQGEFFYPGFNLESYIHRSHFGRDTFVEVKDKGYLFPHGFRVSYVRVTQRYFLPFRDEKGFQDPVAYLVMRHFIMAKVPDKVLPGLYQPFEARDFPAGRAKFLTLRTPDLIAPKLLNVLKGQDPREYIFWPRTKDGTESGSPIDIDGFTVEEAYGSEVVFRYAADGSPTPRAAPMLFISNAATGNPKLMQALVAYYNKLGVTHGLDRLATEDHADGDTTFAPAQRLGDTTFKTRAVLLRARGRIRQQDGVEVEHFDSDAFMEGDDQPPFYPAMRKGWIQIQSLDRLTGTAHGLIEVSYDETYTRYAFDKAHNPSAIYLRVLTRGVDLDVSGQGPASGGVVKPNSRLAALSQTVGLIGGREGEAPRTDAPALTPVGSVEVGGGQGPFNLEAAKAGRFDPVEFFSGALAEAKLLGILSLKDVIRAADIAGSPRLQETLKYGAAQNLPALLKAGAAAVRKAIDSARAAADKKLADVLPGIQLEDLYPDLMRRVGDLEQALKGCEALTTKSSADELLSAATDLVRRCDDLRAAVRKVLDNPIPPLVETALEALQDIRSILEAPLKAIERALVNALQKALQAGTDAALEDLYEAIIVNDLFETFFGVLNGGADPLVPNRTFGVRVRVRRPLPPDEREKRLAFCRNMARDPKGTLSQASETLFFNYLTGPLLRALSGFSELASTANASLNWSQQALAGQIAGILRREAAKAAGLADLRANCLSEAAFALTAVIDAELAKPFGANPKAELAQRLGNLPKAMQPVFARMVGPAADAAGQIIAESIPGECTRAAAEIQMLDADLGKLRERLRGLLPDADREKLEVWLSQLIVERQRLAEIADRLPKFASQVPSIAGAIVENARPILEAAVQDLIDSLRARAQAAADDIVRRVTGMAEGLLESALQSAILAATSEAGRLLDGFCGPAGPVTSVKTLAGTLVSETLAPAGIILKSLKDANDALGRLGVPAAASSPALQDLREIIASVRTDVQRVTQVVEEIERLRLALSPNCDPQRDGFCVSGVDCATDPGPLLELTSASFSLRTRAAAAIRDAARQMQACAERLPKAVGEAGWSLTKTQLDDANTALADLHGALKGLLKQLTSIQTVSTSTAAWGQLRAALVPLEKASPAITSALSDIERAAKDLDSALQKTTAGTLAETAKLVVAYASGPDKNLATAVLSLAALPKDVSAKLMELARRSLASILPELVALHTNALPHLDRAIRTLRGEEPGAEGLEQILLLLGGPTLVRLQAVRDAIAQDEAALIKMNGGLAPAGQLPLADLQALRDRWKGGQSSLAVGMRMIADMVTAIAAGRITDIIPLVELEKTLREAVTDLIPTEINLNYDWQTPLSDFPSGDPIFSMDRSAPRSKLTNPDADLILSTEVKVNLLTGERRFSTTGEIGPFKVRLLGSAFDMLTLSFSKAIFTVSEDGKKDFDAPISKVEFGALLQFLGALSSVLGGYKFYALPVFNPVGIEAGFSYAKDKIDLSPSLQFLNVAFGASAFLPFQDLAAELRFYFASREKPFLVVAPPYGGGGFVALVASARGIVSFEIMIELGFVGNCQYGLFKGHARLTAGFYLASQANGGRILEGFVHAIGEGSIACFGISVAIEVSMRQVNGGAMVGSSTYRFTFKIGFASVSYSFTATYTVQGGTGGRQLAAQSKTPTLAGPVVEVFAPEKTKQWPEYRRYISIDW